MKFLQKSAAFVLILAMVACLLLPGGLVLQANAAENVVYTVSDFQINPLYADVISESDLLHSPPTLGADPDGQAEDPEYVTTIEEAAVTLREAMKQRADTVTIYFQTPELSKEYTEADFKGQIQAIVVEAMEHTGVPTEGDYIKWQYAGWRYEGSAASTTVDGTTVFQWILNFSLTYYTTKDQEKELDAAVEKLLESMDIAEAPDYLKIKTIYDYITEHVVYDHDNLNDDSYTLKYTAYAALQDGTAVCQGYALLLYRLALELDVDCRLIAGMGGNEAHGWNIIELKDLYYNMDATWDAGATAYNYFLRCGKNFPNHTRDAEYDTKTFHATYPMAEENYAPIPSDSCKHDAYDNGQVTTQPTCDKEGVKTFTCTNCGFTYTKPIPTVDHTYETEVVDPTCAKEGLTTYTCSVCGYSYTEAIPTLDHEYEITVTDPTCTEQGYTTYTCTGCGKYYIGEHTDPLGHEYDAEALVYDPDTRTHSATCIRCDVQSVEDCTFLEGAVTREPSIHASGILEYVCTGCGGTYEKHLPYRISGSSRYETAFQTAEDLKECLGVETFEYIVVAYGRGFADALAGSYLATELNAPILLTEDSFHDEVIDYIDANLSRTGWVYILGGPSTISQSFEDSLNQIGINCARLYGGNRYETNLAILDKAGLNSKTILVCTGTNFADSLSASAVNLPILLVGNTLSAYQEEYLGMFESLNFCIIGGPNSVSERVAEELRAYGTVKRISGNTREATSVLVAEAFCPDPDTVALAYSRNFPDGLCGGPLAYQLGAPLLLVSSGAEALAADYVTESDLTAGIILGGTNSISNETANRVFGN